MPKQDDNKSVSVSFRVTPRFKRCLELAASHEDRSQTNVLEKLLFDFCRKNKLDPADTEAQESTDIGRRVGDRGTFG